MPDDDDNDNVGDTPRSWRSEIYCAMAQAVSHKSVTLETRVRCYVSRGTCKFLPGTDHESPEEE